MKSILNRINNKLNNIYLKKKLILLYSVCAILPIIILSTFLITNTKKRLMTLSDSQITADNQANRAMLLSVTNLTSAISKIIASDEELLQIISTDYDTHEAAYTAYRNFTLLDEFSSNHTEITDLRLYFSNPSLVSSGKYYMITDEITATPWYMSLLQNPAEIVWHCSESFSKTANLYLLRKITLPHSDYYAILCIGVSNNYLSSMNQNQLQTTFLSLDDGYVFYSTDNTHISQKPELNEPKELRGYSASRYKMDGKEVFGLESTLKSYASSQVFHITTISADNRQISQTIWLILLLILMITAIPLIIFYAFSNNYTSRLLIVREQMHRIAQGKFSMEDNLLGTDELGALYQDMKITMTEIQNLNTKILEEQKEKDQLTLRQQQIQFELLASQINPHFLFNTLETIRMHALLANQTEINNIILKLGQTLRYALDTPSTNTTLANSLDYLEAYLEIQHFRFQDKLNYSIQVHPNLDPKKVIMLPFLLQPIVENAVIHGFATKKKGGTIKINVLLRNERLVITITDNGCGIPPKKLEELNLSLASYHKNITTSHIGMHNVNNRIKLHYGELYGLHIESLVEKGTTVTIEIPHKEA